MRTKNQLPLALWENEPLSPALRLYLQFNHLKHLYRQGWLRRGVPEERCESVAEHSFGVALLAIFLADAMAPGLDRSRLVLMALFHDLGEIYVGDLTPHDPVSPAQKEEAERTALQRLFADLPQQQEYLQVWEEYTAQVSPEARFVKEIDQLEMLLQAGIYEKQGYADLQEFFDHVGSLRTYPALQAILQEMQRLRSI